jgi:ribosome-binding protein aMBF1 (putative translation factor)
MAKAFDTLRKSLPAKRQVKIAARTEELLASLPLQEIRQARKLSQEELAKRLNINQAAVSKVENRTDLYISTLRKHIEAMGGRLVLEAHFPEGSYRIDDLNTMARTGNEKAG